MTGSDDWYSEAAQREREERRKKRGAKSDPKMFSREEYREEIARVTKRRARGDYTRNPDDMTHMADLLKDMPDEVQLGAAKRRRKREAEMRRGEEE